MYWLPPVVRSCRFSVVAGVDIELRELLSVLIQARRLASYCEMMAISLGGDVYLRTRISDGVVKLDAMVMPLPTSMLTEAAPS